MPHSYRAPALYIDGEWIAETAASEQITNPATGAVIGHLPHADPALIDRALAAAGRAFPLWRDTAPAARAEILGRGAQILRGKAEEAARHIVLEQGKPLAEARLEIESCAGMLDWCADAAQQLTGTLLPSRPGFARREVIREPVGPIAAFAPWNFPASIPARKIAAALAVGCTAIVKPAEETPAGFAFVVEALHAAGLPAGVLNLLYGDPAGISTRLVASPVIRKIAFTGSTRVGCLIAAEAGRHAKPCVLELGGHSPVLVFDDAELEETIDLLIAAKFRNGGQICGSPTRFYVQEGLFDAFAEGFTRRAAALCMGDGMEPGTELGPMISRRRVEALHDLVQDAQAAGAVLRTGGALPNRPGSFYPPTVLQEVPETAQVMQEEPFGPLAILNRFRDPDEAMARANGTPYALAAYAFSASPDRLDWAARHLDAGLVGLNSYAVVFPDSPIGGRRASGYGSEGGLDGLQEYLISKFVSQEG